MLFTISSPQLSLATQGDDVAQLHQALRALGRSIPASETSPPTMGLGTVAIVNAVQQDLGIPVTGVVDAATVAAINKELAAIAGKPRIVRGLVTDSNGNPVKGLTVSAFRQTSGGEVSVGGAVTGDDGSYVIPYHIVSAGPVLAVDLRLQVVMIVTTSTVPLQRLLATIPSSQTILTDADLLEVVNFVLVPSADVPAKSEYEQILSDLAGLLGTRALPSLQEDGTHRDVSLLAAQSGYATHQLAALVRANQLAKDAAVPPQIVYALLRQGLPADLRALQAVHPDLRLKALRVAVSQSQVPAAVDGKSLEDLLAGFAPISAAPLRSLLGTILPNAADQDKLVALYAAKTQDLDAFWTQVGSDPVLGPHAADLKLTMQIASLTNKHEPLVKAVKAQPGIKQASDLVRISQDQWRTLIQGPGIGVPPGTPGATPQEQIANYVDRIVREVEAAFPTAYFVQQLPASPVKTFLQKQTAYDLNFTYPAQFFKQNPAAAKTLTPQDQGQLFRFQRIYRLTGNTSEALALSATVQSAQQIARMDRAAFSAQFSAVLSPGRADEIYDQALRTNALALALYSENAATTNRTSMRVLPALDTAKQAALAQNSIPDWQTLFGNVDFCACQECTSAHSAAAYLVDILSFLEQRPGSGGKSARELLFARRPDLGDIELSCENTNTPVPTIDLVNEILEDTVSPPAVFAPFPLASKLEADLAQPIATAALEAAFHPPLQPGAAVEVLEAGKRWRVWDTAFVYGVVKTNNALSVATRSRQTSGSADERHGTPQYRNSAAYADLKQALFPWNLPFDLASEEAKVFLTHLGVSRRDLIEALRPSPDPFNATSPDVISIAAEGLGLTDMERRIIVGEQQGDFWGAATLAQLSQVQELLNRSDLEFADLDALIQTSFVNPKGAVSITGTPADTCDPRNLKITGLTADVRDRIHQFVRLWRKLGWTIADTDRVLRAFEPKLPTPVLTNEILVRLDHLRILSAQLHLPVVQALAFWSPVDTVEPGSLYDSLFFNPAVFRPQDDAFRLNPSGNELADLSQTLTAHGPVIQAAFRLNAASFVLLVSKTDGKLNLANLSLLYRHAVLARQLSLTVEDLLSVLDLTGLDPFTVATSQEAVQFVAIVQAVQTSGFSIPQLAYLVRHKFNSPAPFVPLDSDLAFTLEALRADLTKVAATGDAPDLKQNAATACVIDRISSALNLPGDVTSSLLGRLTYESDSALQRFLRLSDISVPLTRVVAGPHFEILEKLLKIAMIIRMIDLPNTQLDWLFRENPWLSTAPDPPASPVPFNEWYSLVLLQRVRRDLSLTPAAVESLLGALTAVAQLANKQDLADALMNWVNFEPDDIAALIGQSGDISDLGLFKVAFPSGYGIDLIARIGKAMRFVRRLGVAAANASEWCNPALSDSDAQAIRGAAKAKYDDANWNKIVIPLQNALRDAQRRALSNYLTARPAKWNKDISSASPNDLFEFFLIDVEMSSCQVTSRIKQALGSVQIFAQRCLMGLEGIDATTDEKWAQWDWMKNFRVWEANRKIWLYPENWMQPELRDDKTPFFKDLETELLQSDLDNSAAEQALMHYLEKLDAVARLQIAGMYEDDERKVLHVFGRTFHTPNVYYYRRREGVTQSWTPWEKLDLDIAGDHLIPVVFHRKLMLIWPIFTQKQMPKPVVMPGPGEALGAGDPYWEIQLAWSEYQYGRWSEKNLSDAVTFCAWLGEDNILFGPRVPKSQALPGNGGGPSGGRATGGSIGPPPPPPFDNSVGTSRHIQIRTAQATGSSDSETALGSSKQIVPVEMISFKALVSSDGETLAVRGYLRRDYRSTPDGDDPGIAFPFGEFRFSGCRKVATAVPDPQIAGKSFALAPTGTKFDGMWFSQVAPGLTLFDGTFLVFSQILPPPTLLTLENDYASIAGDPSSTKANKINIPVLDQTPSSFQLLAPHQDIQFTARRPFFFEDGTRAFFCDPHRQVIDVPGRGSWVGGDVATAQRANYFSDENPAASNPSSTVPPLTVLLSSPGGLRIARELPPINLAPDFTLPTLLPTSVTLRFYPFENFHHPYLCEFIKALDAKGISELMANQTQNNGNPQSFLAYGPKTNVPQPYPVDEVEFRSGGAYELYNWELFFHIPLLIATRLSRNQRFADAQRWFHYIFDPSGKASADTQNVVQRYWSFKPFHDRVSSDYEAESVTAIETMAASGPPPELKVAIEEWRTNPFNPFVVARLRSTAFQKMVVMKYIDNLIAWGDQLFGANTLETINEATLLYVRAAEILGPRPEVIDRNLKPTVQTFNTLANAGPLGNALEQIELLAPAAGGAASLGSGQEPDPPSDKILYFCVSENDQLLGYWDTVADRLFKIRHCMSIQGQVQQLPLFEPPIDPALLVRARAAGISIADILQDITPSLPNYRFSSMLQKANEVAAEVRNLGSEMLSVLEKSDAEALATLRSGQELSLLTAVRDIRQQQIDEAGANISGLEQSRAMAQAKKDFFEGRQFMNDAENVSVLLAELGLASLALSSKGHILGSLLVALGSIKIGAPTTMGTDQGPAWIGQGVLAFSSSLDVIANLFTVTSQLAARQGEFDRRQDEWNYQANLATIELKQIDQQLAAANIRLAIAQQELRNHDLQIENARDTDQFLRSKFTNQDLFQWMIGQVSSVYFQSYQLAYDLAKRTEMCMQHELGLDYGSTSVIQFGYWDSLKKGLLAGDRLSHDLRRLEIAYLDGNEREYELTKHVSLVSLAPEQLVNLKEKGECQFNVPEWLFDLDTPGHYLRRLKMVSLTIPCVTGPYTTIHCKITLVKNSYRKNDSGDVYDRLTDDARFVDNRQIVKNSIVTSTGQNDSGLFEPGMRDERYLPFEGAGAISTWTLELPNEFKTFDYGTISDVVLHLRFTARSSDALRDKAVAALKNQLASVDQRPLFRFVSLRHEFPAEWRRFVTSTPSASSPLTLTVNIDASRFPYFVQGRRLQVGHATVLGRTTDGSSVEFAVAPGSSPPPDLNSSQWDGQAEIGQWTVAASDNRNLGDIFLILAYSVMS